MPPFWPERWAFLPFVGAPQATQLIDSDSAAMAGWRTGTGLRYWQRSPGRGADHGRKTCPWNAGHHQPVVIIPRGDALNHSLLRSLRTKVMVNLSQSRRRLKELPYEQNSDGIGLLRSEWLMLEILGSSSSLALDSSGPGSGTTKPFGPGPGSPFCRALGNKPVRYRSLDLRSHEWLSLEGSPTVDTKPMLGLRGTLSYTLDARLFEVELGALATLQQAGVSQPAPDVALCALSGRGDRLPPLHRTSRALPGRWVRPVDDG